MMTCDILMCDMLTGDVLMGNMLTGDVLIMPEGQFADDWQCYAKVV
jgi:hypothetical protein